MKRREFLEFDYEDLSPELKKEYLSEVRFVIGYNREVAFSTKLNRRKNLKKFRQELRGGELRGGLDEMTERLKSLEGVLKVKKLKRFYKLKLVKLSQGKDIYEIRLRKDMDALKREHLLDGRYFLQTEVSKEKITTEEATQSYKSLMKVEQAFRVIKDTIELRPIYVRREKRIRGHVFICFLAFLIEALLERTMKEKGIDTSMIELKEELSRIKLISLNLPDKKRIYISTNVERKIQRLFTELKIINYARPERLKIGTKPLCTHNNENQGELFPQF